MKKNNFKKIIINTSSSDVKLINTPIGVYLKRTKPYYYARKLPYKCNLVINKNLIIIWIPKKFYHKDKFYKFLNDENIKNYNDFKNKKIKNEKIPCEVVEGGESITQI